MILTYTLNPLFTIKVAPIAPTKQTIEPTLRSILPPVRIHNNIPVARINTYAFCAIKLLTFCGSNILPPVFHVKNKVTRISTITIVYFLKNTKVFSLPITYSPSPDFRMCDMIFSCVASFASNSPTIFPAFIT